MEAVTSVDLFDAVARSIGSRERANRVIFISERHNYVYVANQKAACSSIKLMLYRAELDDPKYDPPGSVHSRSENPVAQPKDFGSERLQALLAGDAFRFTFVRNPYARLISYYRDKIEKLATGKLNAARGYDPKERSIFLRGKKQDEIDRFTFADFVHAVCSQEDAKMNPHWRPQVINTCFGVMPYDFVGRLETFAYDIRHVQAATSMVAPWERNNVSGASRVEEYFTPDLADIVYSSYRDDFEAFQYPRSI